MNAVVALYIFMLVPEFFLRFLSWILANLIYRFRIRGDAYIPEHGAALLTCNHVSFVDALLLMAASPRPIRFIMDHRIFKMSVLGAIFRLARTIPVARARRIPRSTRTRSPRRTGRSRRATCSASFPRAPSPAMENWARSRPGS